MVQSWVFFSSSFVTLSHESKVVLLANALASAAAKEGWLVDVRRCCQDWGCLHAVANNFPASGTSFWFVMSESMEKSSNFTISQILFFSFRFLLLIFFTNFVYMGVPEVESADYRGEFLLKKYHTIQITMKSGLNQP